MIRYLLIEPNKLPKVKNTENMENKIKELFSNNCSEVLNEMVDYETFEKAEVIGYPLGTKNTCNRLIYRNYHDKAIGGVITGPFIIVGKAEDKYISLTNEQIHKCNLLYGKRSIKETLRACYS